MASGRASSNASGGDSTQSTTINARLVQGTELKLLYPQKGHVGLGEFLEVHLGENWPGFNIPVGSEEYVLLRPTKIFEKFLNLILVPQQRGLDHLHKALDRIVLWRVSDVEEACPFIPREEWLGQEVQRKSLARILLASVRINCCFPDDHFKDGTLGEGNIGVNVLDVFVEDITTIMSHEKWPISECAFANGHTLTATLEYFVDNG